MPRSHVILLAFVAALALPAVLLWPNGPTHAPLNASQRASAHEKSGEAQGWGPSLPGKVAPDVQEALKSSSSVSVIVSLASKPVPRPGQYPGVDLAALASSVATTGARVLAAVPPSQFQLVRQYKAVPALAGSATAAGVWALAKHPEVVHVALNRQVRADLAQAVPLINADDAHNLLGVTGDGVVVAVLDTGIDTDHPLLADDLVHQECSLSPPITGECPGGGSTGSSAEDGHGHGTHVSGIITSAGPPVGVAPDALIAAFKILDDYGWGTFADLLWAYDRIILNHPEVDIINMSLGDGGSYRPGACESFIPAFTTAIATTRSMGMTTFAASGNNGSKSGISYPACINDVVSVGAVYDDDVGPQDWGICSDLTTAADQVVCFSQSNDSLDLLAPGATIDSTVPGGGLGNYSGTSMASPMAAGVAALLLESEPLLTPADVEARLTETGVPVTDPGNGVQTCRVDAYEAVVNDGGPVCSTEPPPPPTNDDFEDAIVIPEPLPYTNSQFTMGATRVVGEPLECIGAIIDATVWYKYTPTSDQAILASTFGSNYDTVLGVYTGPSVHSLTQVACDDDTYGLQSLVWFQATAGTTYYFQIGGYNGATGNLTFNVETFVATCPDVPTFSFMVPDPQDAFGFFFPNHEILSVGGEGDASTLCLTVEFAGPVDPADAGTGQEVVGYIDFDTDQNPFTGYKSIVDILCPAPSGMGVEASLDLFSVSSGFGLIDGHLVPIVFDTTSFTAIIPLDVIGGENFLNFGMILGSLHEPTDCAPANGGCIVSPTGAMCQAPLAECVFTDDFGRGTQFLVTGGSGRFIGPGIDVSGVRVLRIRNRAIALHFQRDPPIIVRGRGTCPNGPGTFRALKLFPLPPARWLLQDVTR